MNKTWWKAAGIRAIKTMAQVAIATIGTEAMITSVNWLSVLSTVALSGVLSILTSIGGLPECDKATETAGAEIISSPEIEGEEIIDTSKEDAELKGNIIPDEKDGE